MWRTILSRFLLVLCGLVGVLCLLVGVLLTLWFFGESLILTCFALAVLLAGMLLLEFAYRRQAAAVPAEDSSAGDARDLAPGDVLALQAVVFAFFALLLDGGLALTASAYSYLGYALGALLLLVRRGKKLTSGDVLYLRWAWLPIIAIGVPLFLRVWRAKGLI